MLTLAAAATSRMVGRDRLRTAGDFLFVNVVQDRAPGPAQMAVRSHLAFSSSPCYTLTTLSLTTLSGTPRGVCLRLELFKGVTLYDW